MRRDPNTAMTPFYLFLHGIHVRGFNVYRMAWIPRIGEIPHLEVD